MSDGRSSGVVAWTWVAGLANALGAAGLAAAAAWLLLRARHGLAGARERAQYAGGMLVASVGVAAAIGALALAALGLGCWLVRRRVRRNARPGALDVLFLCVASAPPVLLLVFALSR